MRVKYFSDTDTLLITLSDGNIVESRDINEDTLMELDEQGHVVSLTIEHAQQKTDIREITVELSPAG